MSQNEYISRKKRYSEAAGREGLQALFISNLPDVRYLCGFTGSNGNILLMENRGYFFTDFRYREQAAGEVQGFEVIVYEGGLGPALAEVLRKREGITLGFDPATLSYAEVALLKKSLRGMARPKPIRFSTTWLRARKSSAEIRAIRRAVRVAEKSLLKGLALATPETTEAGFSVDLDFEARGMGAERSSFETIVATGTRGSIVHAKPTRKKLRGATVIDWGILYRGYCTDMTRTISFGNPTGTIKKIHAVVLKAQEAAIKKIKPGVKASDLDVAARAIIEEAGYGEHFGHALGHGVGLEVHERPYIAKTSRDVIEEGMVFTVEPGVYLPGKGGVRIEDMVLVTPDGCEMLSELPRSLELETYI